MPDIYNNENVVTLETDQFNIIGEGFEILPTLAELPPIPISKKKYFNPNDFPHSDKPFNFKLDKIKLNRMDNFDWDIDIEENELTMDLFAEKPQTVVKERKFRKIGNCCGCKTAMFEDGKTQYYRAGERDQYGERTLFYCFKCSKNFEMCERCGQNFLSKNLVFKNCPYCVECSYEHYVLPYNAKVEQNLKKKGEPRDRTFFGIELELASTRLGLDTLIVHNLVKDFAQLKRDRSIMIGEKEFQGFEIVSCPCSAEVHQTLWNETFEKLPETCFPNESCGMHVHVSRVETGDCQLGKLLMIFYSKKNRQFIETIAERPSSHHNNFHETRQICEAKEGGFAKPHDRHSALNFNNRATVEFRIFASTKDKFTFLKNLEFCGAIMKFTEMALFSIPQIQNFANFVLYVKQNYKLYPNLWKFMMSKPLFMKLI